MVSTEFGMRILRGVLELAGTFVSIQMSPDATERMEANLNTYYTKAIAAAKKKQKELMTQTPTKAEIQMKIERAIPEKTRFTQQTDLTTKKIEGGTACLACSRDHFSTTSSALSEAVRFSRKEAMSHHEIQRRLGIALDELNICERIDLAPDNILNLPSHEKRIAETALEASRDLRHDITSIRTKIDLEKVAAKAARIRTDFMRQIFELATADGTINKLCEGLENKEKKKCMTAIENVLNKEQEMEENTLNEEDGGDKKKYE